MDLSKFELTDADVKRLDVLHPGTGEKMPDIWIDLLPIDSPGYRAAQREAQRKRLEDETRTLRLDLKQVERDQTEDMALAIVGWNGIGIDGKDELPFSVDVAIAIMIRLPWLRAQVEAFLRRRANFLPSGNGDYKSMASPNSN